MDNIVLIDLDTPNRTIFASAYYQYDRGLKVRLQNVPDCRDYSLQIEFCNTGDKVIKYYFPNSGDGVEIPEPLLLDGRKVGIYVFAKGSDWGKTIQEVILNVTRRPSR